MLSVRTALNQKARSFNGGLDVGVGGELCIYTNMNHTVETL